VRARYDVFLRVDEAHRTTSGDLRKYLLAVVPSCTMIGLTATAIDRIAYGKGTFKVLGKDVRVPPFAPTT
jgi:type I restriction enzyme R subunit